MSPRLSLEEQSRRSRCFAIKEYRKVADLQEQRRLVEANNKMKAGEKYVAMLFPDLPVGMGVDRVLWACSDALDASAVYVVQLSPLIVPLIIALTWGLVKYVGVVAALLFAAAAVGALFWAESTAQQRAIFKEPTGTLDAHSVGKPVVTRVAAHMHKGDGVRGGSDAVDGNSAAGTSGAAGRAPQSGSQPSAYGAQPSGAASVRKAPDMSDPVLQELSSGLRALSVCLYGQPTKLTYTGLEDCHGHLKNVAREVGTPEPAEVSIPALQACLSTLRRELGC